MKLVYIMLALIAGTFIPVQAGVNSLLRQWARHKRRQSFQAEQE